MRITERQLRQIIREELSEMRKPEGDPSNPSYASAMRRYYKSQEQGDEPKRPSSGHGRFPGMDDDDEGDYLAQLSSDWKEQNRRARGLDEDV